MKSTDSRLRTANQLLSLKPLQATHMLVFGAAMLLGLLVCSSMALWYTARTDVVLVTNQIIAWQIATLVFGLLVALVGTIGLSRRATRVSNREDMKARTENLGQLVTERTFELGQANEQILSLNAKLADENLRLGAELNIARQVQMMVLPKLTELSAIPLLDIASFIQPADEVGGDYYDVLQSGNRVKIGIGDVTGHGLESGVLMLMVQSVARALLERGEDDPKTFLTDLNKAIYKNIERTETGKHLSLSFIDYVEGQLTVTGQHEEVLIIRKNGDVERIDTIDLGFPIGLEFDISPFVASKQIAFGSGDVMILYSDGVTEAEAPDGRLFGIDGLHSSALQHYCSSAEQIKSDVINDLMAHIGSQTIHDDIALVVVRHL